MVGDVAVVVFGDGTPGAVGPQVSQKKNWCCALGHHRP